MARFDGRSRYKKFSQTLEVRDRKGRTVMALTPAEIPRQSLLGEHQKQEYQRLDHLANFYLGDPNGFWRIASKNGVLLPDVLLRKMRIKIPTRF